MPLRPGESFVLKIPENNLVGFEGLVAKGKITQSEVKTVYLMFRHLNFGDKTGFSGGGFTDPQHRFLSVLPIRDYKHFRNVGIINHTFHVRVFVLTLFELVYVENHVHAIAVKSVN